MMENDPDSNLYEWEKADLPAVVRNEIIMLERDRDQLQIRLQEAYERIAQLEESLVDR